MTKIEKIRMTFIVLAELEQKKHLDNKQDYLGLDIFIGKLVNQGKNIDDARLLRTLMNIFSFS
jgi:hypothetical protein